MKFRRLLKLVQGRASLRNWFIHRMGLWLKDLRGIAPIVRLERGSNAQGFTQEDDLPYATCRAAV